MKAKAIVIVLAAAALAGADQVFHLQGDDGNERAMDYEPQSGVMKMCEGASCSQGRRQIQFRLSRLVEVTAGGVPVPDHYVDLEQLTFGFTPLPPAEMRDSDGNPFTPLAFQVVRNVSLHGSGANDIVVNVTGLIAPRQVQMFMYGRDSNMTVDVPERGLKLYFQIHHWPFASAQNALLLVSKIKVQTRKGEGRRPPQLDGDDKPVASPDPARRRRGAPEKRFRLGDDGDNQFLDSPSAVVVDGRLVENAVQLRLNPADDHEMAFVWAFPYFRDSVVYDPTIAMSSTTATTGGAATSASMRSTASLNPFVFVVIAFAFLLV